MFMSNRSLRFLSSFFIILSITRLIASFTGCSTKQTAVTVSPEFSASTGNGSDTIDSIAAISPARRDRAGNA